MRVLCRHCNEVAKVVASREETAGLRTVYVTCAACGSKQVWQLSYCHDTRPPAVDWAKAAVEVLEKLSAEDRRRVLARFEGARQPLLMGTE